MQRVDGWAARTDGPLGPIPFLVGAVTSAVIAIVFTSPWAWIAFAIFASVLAVRAVRWCMRQIEAVQVERETQVMLEREPRLVPLYHAPRWGDREYHKAS
jgi:hypothetical protein